MTDLRRLPSGDYRMNGRILPGVTKVLGVLRPYAMVPKDTLALAQDRGKAAHLAVHLLEGGGDGSGLNWDTVHPIVRPYVEAWCQFKRDTSWVTEWTEAPVASQVYGYCCTPDLVGRLRGVPTVIDAKTGASALVALQLAAQAQAIKETRTLKAKPRRYSLTLTSRGTYRLREWTDAADFPSFCAILQTYQWVARYAAPLAPAEIEPDYACYEEIFG